MELDYMQLKLRAIDRFKAVYAIFDNRLKQAKETRFSFAMNETECILGLKYYGKKYKQYYKTQELCGHKAERKSSI